MDIKMIIPKNCTHLLVDLNNALIIIIGIPKSNALIKENSKDSS